MPPPLMGDIDGGAKALERLVAFDWLVQIDLARNSSLRIWILRTVGVNKL
jgi:hypothetical protein